MEIDTTLHFLLPHLETMKTIGIAKNKTFGKQKSKERKINQPILVILWHIQFPHFLFQGQADLLQHTKAEVQENMKQIHDAALTGNLTKEGVGVRRVHSLPRRGLDDKPFAKRANDQQVKEDASRPPPQLH